MNKRTVLMFDPSAEGAEIAAWLEKRGDLNVIYDKKYGVFTNHLFTAQFDLVITELEIEGVREGDLLKNIRQKNKDVFHIVITKCKDLYRVAFAEVNGVRQILFKPLDYKQLEEAIDITICGRKTFLIAASEPRAKYISSSITSEGHYVQIVQKEYELNRIFLNQSIDYIFFDDSFDVPSADSFFKRISTLNRNGTRSLAILKRTPDPVLRTTLEAHSVEKILPGTVNGEGLAFAVDEFLRRQPLIEKEKEEKQEKKIEEEKQEEQKKADLDKEKKLQREKEEKEKKAAAEELQRKESAGKFTVAKYLRELEEKFYDQAIIAPVKDYMRTRNPESGEAMFKLLDSDKGQPVLLMLSEVFGRADSHFKEFLLDIFTELDNQIVVNTLLLALKDKDPEIRFLAILSLQGKKDDRIKTFVAFRLLDEAPKVRKSAAKILEENADIQIVKAMVDGIKKYGDGNIAESLALILEKKVKVSENFRFYIEIYTHVPRDVKEIIINEFVKTGSKDILPFLLREMKSSDDILSRLAVDGIDKLKNPMALPQMIDYMKGNDAFYIQDVAQNLLANVKSKKYIPLLEKVVNDGTSNLKEAAIELLKDMGGKEALFLILKTLGDSTPSVKMAAIDALTMRKKKYVVPSLIYVLDDNNAIVRERTAEVLKSMIDKNDIEILLGFFKKATTDEAKEIVADFLHSLLADKDASAMEKFLKKDSFHLLLDVLKQKGYSLGKYTTSILGDKFASEESYDAIMKTLYSDSDEARAEALIALGKIANPASLPHVVKFLNDPTWFIRRNAVEALKPFKNPKTVAYAEKLMDDENAAVRLSSIEFLKIMNMKYRERALLWAVAEESTKVLRQIPPLLAPFKDQELANVYLNKADAVDPGVRIQAARKLLEMWDQINFEYLMKNINHSNWRLRLFSFMIMCDKQPQEARKFIDTFCKDASPEIRKELPELFLGVFHEESFKLIKGFALNDEDIQVRKNSIKLLPSYELDENMKDFLHELMENETNNGCLMEIGFALDSLDYELPREVQIRQENKFPNELKQIITKIKKRHHDES